MVDYETKAPGVYLEEPPSLAGPIAGVGTSVAALIGTAAKPPDNDHPLGEPVLIDNWTAFKNAFGEYKTGLSLPFAVRGFFENGGTLAYIVPIKDLGGLDDALNALTRVADVSLVCLPGVVDAKVQTTVIQHCEKMRDRLAILDGAQDQKPSDNNGALQTQLAGLDLKTNGFGALYWPWIKIPNPNASAGEPDTVPVPPSGHVAGVMARCDTTVGVHKAPANETVRGAVGLEYMLNDDEQGMLNQKNINGIRHFPGRPPLVWGARTLTTSTLWRFVNVRRLVCYIEDSIIQGVRWAVFAPNNKALWKGLERSITEFLTRVWEAGALFGASAKEAFYVRITEELNPPSVREFGQVIVEIGLAVTRPAEHIVVRIGLWDGGAQISEG